MPFYPDASRIFEEIDRLGVGGGGRSNLLSSKADFDFYRPAPSGGYRKGLPASERTDVGDGDIPEEVWGEDFFTYVPVAEAPAMSTLARLTNVVQSSLATGEYAGAIWLEGRQTKSLKLKAGNGYEYVFRSVNKDPSGALPFELRGTLLEKIIKDQTTTQQPYGAMATDLLLNKLDILHAHPVLYVMPDDPMLGP